jgi:hypothetical protein
MIANVRRVLLIYSALLGALVISCASPPTSVVAPVPAAVPAPQGESAPQGGLQGVQEAPPPVDPQAVTQPAPQAIPLPAVPPAQAPVAAPKAVPAPAIPPGRPGGAPPGTEQVTVPGGNVSLDEWKDRLAAACDEAHAGQNCLKLDINYQDNDGNKLPKKGRYTDCQVDSQKPQIGARKPVGSSVHLEVTCDTPPKSNTSGESDSGTGDASTNSSKDTGSATHSDTSPKHTGTGGHSDHAKNHDGK